MQPVPEIAETLRHHIRLKQTTHSDGTPLLDAFGHTRECGSRMEAAPWATVALGICNAIEHMQEARRDFHRTMTPPRVVPH
jgi:hypothetical protein